MVATLDGLVEETAAIFEAKFMLPWSFSEETAAEKYMAQVQHNMWVTHYRQAALSIITGGGKWVEITIPMDPLYLTVLVTAEKKFWRCVQSGEVPHLINAEPPRPLYRGHPHHRHELIEFLGRVCRSVPQHPQRVSRSRTSKERTQGAHSRGCQRGGRTWRTGKAFEIRRSKL
jgi:hypothetical protein